MTSRLFWKLFLAFATVNIISIVGVAWLSSGGTAATSNVWLFTALVLVSLLLTTLLLIARVVNPVRELTHSAEQMAAGRYDQPVYVGGSDELAQLASTFNSMRQEMGARLGQMRDTNQRLSTVLGGMNDGVIAIDENKQVLFANRAAGEMMGFSPAAAEGRILLESVRSHRLHDLAEHLLASRGQGEVEIEWGEDNPRSLLVSATSFSGEPSAGIVMMIHNLTEARRLESMRRDFVANVSHELKTPLSSIKAYAETLSEGAIHDEANRGRFVQQIEEQADRLNQLITDLLSLARIEQGNQFLDILQVPLNRVVSLCVREQQRAAEEKNIDLVVADSDQEIRVAAEEDGLRQILINLIDNAIKYTPENGQITVGWERDGDAAVIFVEDTGIGIPKEMQARVFERFFRVDKARSRELGGTGLGLAIVKHLSQSFEGTVEVQSEEGNGSRFTVRLPVAPAVDR